jgi:hypothetical protein
VAQGELVYSASPLLDVNLSQEKFDMLTDIEKEEVRY